MQLHLFDNEPVVAFQVRCSGIADVIDAQADELTMHNSVVMVVVGTIDEATHKTNKAGDVIRVTAVKVTEAAIARGEMRMELIDMFHLDGGQLTFSYSPVVELADEADPTTGEMPRRMTVVQ